jgi:photosystem II stability/assembly factor-like uncharacterized protein
MKLNKESTIMKNLSQERKSKISVFSTANTKRLKNTLLLIMLLMLTVPVSLKSQWVKISDGMQTNETIYSLSRNGNTLFAASSDTGLFKSTNNGTNWQYINGVPSNVLLYSVYASGSNIFVGANGAGVYRSVDNGVNWLQVNAGLTDFDPRAFIVKGQYVFAAIQGTKVYRSPNNGTDWFPVTAGLPALNYRNFAIFGNNLYVCAACGVIYKSTNDGDTWAAFNSGVSNTNVYDIKVLGTDMYAASNGGVLRSTNGGSNWVVANQGITGSPQALLTKETNVVAGSTSGVFRSTNNGLTWTNFNQGLTTTNVLSIMEDGTYMYVGTSGGSIFRRPLTEIILGVHNISTEIPGDYTLSQNYPNPFNPVTNINFAIPKSSNVKIKVYDARGKEAATLLNEKMSAGSYRVDFDGADFSSGIYYYTLESDNFIQTKSMILLK